MERAVLPRPAPTKERRPAPVNPSDAQARREDRVTAALEEIRLRVAARAGSCVNTEAEGQAISDSMFLLAALDAVLEQVSDWADISVTRPLVTRPYAAEVFFAAVVRALHEPEDGS